MSKYYPDDKYTCILLVQKSGKRKEKGLFNTGSSVVDVLPGTLLFLQKSFENSVVFECIDQGNVEIECSRNGEYESVTTDELQLLYSVPTCAERLTVFHNKTWLQEGLDLIVGDAVEVQMKGCDPDLIGILRYKGKVSDVAGIYFGVELVVIIYLI